MNLLPADFDLRRVVGEELGQICIDRYQIQLQFDHVRIQGGGKVCLEVRGALTELFHRTWKSSGGLAELIGTTALSWSRRSSNVFSIKLLPDTSLVFETQEGPFEDFVVMVGSEEFWLL